MCQIKKSTRAESKKVHLLNQKKYILYLVIKLLNQKRYSNQLHNLVNQKSPSFKSKMIYLHFIVFLVILANLAIVYSNKYQIHFYQVKTDSYFLIRLN